MGQRKGCGGATSEPKGNLSPETTFLSSPAIPLEVINPFQSMMVSFETGTVGGIAQATYKLFVSQLPKVFTDFYFPPPETLLKAQNAGWHAGRVPGSF